MTENETNRYSNSKVYKLCDDEGYYYYGSTCLPLHKRLYNHKCKAKEEKYRKVYNIFTSERFNANEIKIVLVEEFCLKSKEELLREENKYIESSFNNPHCLNSISAVRDYELKRLEIYAERKRLRDENIEEFRKKRTRI